MQALGLIETRGLVAAIESADVMLKAADVSLVEKTLVGGGLVTITVTGDVAAAKAAVEAAAAAVRKLSESSLISQHVIPRPDQSLEHVIITSTPPHAPTGNDDPPRGGQLKDGNASGESVAEESGVEEPTAEESAEESGVEESVAEEGDGSAQAEEEMAEPETDEEDREAALSDINKEEADRLQAEHGLDEFMKILSQLKVRELRTLAREYKDFGLAGRAISKADKHSLLTEFQAYYS